MVRCSQGGQETKVQRENPLDTVGLLVASSKFRERLSASRLKSQGGRWEGGGETLDKCFSKLG